jgi:hypothetical protein
MVRNLVARMFKQKVLNFCENSHMVKSIKILVCYKIAIVTIGLCNSH